MKTIIWMIILNAPSIVLAGQGWEIEIINNMQPTSIDGQYPRITAHAINGSTCWYDYDLGTWDKYAATQGGKVNLYTEQEESFFTSCSSVGTPRLRDMALFIKENEDSGWTQISPPMQLHSVFPSYAIVSYRVNELLASGEFKHELATFKNYSPWEYVPFTLPTNCGVKYEQSGLEFIESSRDEFLMQTYYGPALRFSVSGKYTADCVSETKAPLSAMAYSLPTMATINVNMTLGQAKRITLPSLDGSSTWELEECNGDTVSTGGVIPRKSKQRIPNKLIVKAINKGVEECILTAWSYSSENMDRNYLTTLKYVFKVK